jgi:transglutaminase-like putative cysteine protease
VSELGTLRRQLGWLLLWALVPLPFLYIVAPPFWLVGAAAGAFLVLRPERVLRSSRLVLNLAAVLILAVVLVTGGLEVGPLRPLGHLLLLLTAVRVVMVDDRTGFLRSVALVAMVWVVAVASSTHPAIAPYFVASAAVGWRFGMRLQLAGLGLEVEDRRGALPRARHLAAAVVAALLVAAPLFVVMPRLGSPWVAGRSYNRSTGFSADVDLGKMGRLTQSQEVALIVRSPDGRRIREDWTRLRGTAFDQVMAGSFVPRRSDLEPLTPTRGVVWLGRERPSLDGLVELEIDLLRPRRYLMLPPGTVAVQAPAALAADPYGGLLVGVRRGEALSYRAWVGGPRPSRAAPPGPRDLLLPRDNAEVRALAVQVAGGLGSPRARADAVEIFLRTSYGYSLESGVKIHDVDPVAWFLLEGREGHCEFFAGAMVVMLRHLEVPARLVAGYAGGDLAPGGEELVVRESNAHAWVEVWLGADRGWVTYDPTPPSGVPGLGGADGLERVRWTWQRLELVWDQRLLSFGLGEQIELVDGAVEGLRRAAELARRRSVALPAAALGALIAAALLGRAWWERRVRPWRAGRRRDRGPASRAVARLARALVPVGGIVPPSATVRSIGRQAAAHWPASALAVGKLVDRAEDELYGAGGGSDPIEIRRLWRAIRRSMG